MVRYRIKDHLLNVFKILRKTRIGKERSSWKKGLKQCVILNSRVTNSIKTDWSLCHATICSPQASLSSSLTPRPSPAADPTLHLPPPVSPVLPHISTKAIIAHPSPPPPLPPSTQMRQPLTCTSRTVQRECNLSLVLSRKLKRFSYISTYDGLLAKYVREHNAHKVC